MPSGVLPTAMVRITRAVAVPTTETEPASWLVTNARCLPRSAATPNGVAPTRASARTVFPAITDSRLA